MDRSTGPLADSKQAPLDWDESLRMGNAWFDRIAGAVHAFGGEVGAGGIEVVHQDRQVPEPGIFHFLGRAL